MTREEAIGALTMCRELMLFDPLTVETHDQDNQDLYNACGMAIKALELYGVAANILRINNERLLNCKHTLQTISLTLTAMDGTLNNVISDMEGLEKRRI